MRILCAVTHKFGNIKNVLSTIERQYYPTLSLSIVIIIMLILSWNVAGLKPALQKIHSDYGGSSASSSAATASSSNATTASSSKSTKTKIDPFTNYLRLHGDIDLLCLQEHKIPLTQLSSRSEPHRCSTIDGYESFWSCATDQKSKGFNGVVTYAKVGTVQSANSTPLNDPELDNQGRCIMTNHGKFVVFNVYVPCGGGTHTLPKKMKFLHALSNAMEKQRAEGKHVILVGDMNLKIDKRDVYWKGRCLNVDDILHDMKVQQQQDGGGVDFPKWKKDLSEHWSTIEQVLQTKEAMPRQTTNPSTKQTYDRFRTRVTIGGEKKSVMLGSYEDSAEEALAYYTFDGATYIDPISNTNDTTVYRKKNLMCVDTLVELMSKIGNVTWDEITQREIANSDEVGLNPDNPPTLWMKGLLDGENGMVDVFRHFYPTAEGRFTVWHQMQQKRYTNEGTRIDFTLVDKALMCHVKPNDGQTLRCGKEPHSDPLGEEAAFNAATAGGLFVGGSFQGGGIASATQRALDTQFGESHNGMIYTPPSYSDHIGVSLVMKDSFKDFMGDLELSNDTATKKAQPHKKQRSISSFFSSAASSSTKKSSSTISSKSAASSSSASASAGMKRSANTQDEKGKAEKKKGLYSFFGNIPKATSKENDTNDTSKDDASFDC